MLGAISLLVGGIGILTIMTISVNERTGEVGLLRALGAGRRQVMALFLGEAVVLSGVGGLTGLLLGIGGAWLISAAVPGLPTVTHCLGPMSACAADRRRDRPAGRRGAGTARGRPGPGDRAARGETGPADETGQPSIRQGGGRTPGPATGQDGRATGKAHVSASEVRLS